MGFFLFFLELSIGHLFCLLHMSEERGRAHATDRRDRANVYVSNTAHLSQIDNLHLLHGL